MARPSMAPQRNLTLPEELEKLEQSITLTLQEIDHNFSRAHRIVTSSIIPVVEQYARHSDACWEGSKFWKEFFEASANMSLNHEEAPEDDETALDDTQTSQEHDDYGTPSSTGADRDTATASSEKPRAELEEDLEDASLLDSPSVTVPKQSTPRRQPTSNRKEPKSARKQVPKDATFAEYPSPYETLKQELEGKKPGSKAPTTPGRRIDASAMTPHASSPFAASTQKRRQNADPLFHRMLDKTYRVHATPHAARPTAEQDKNSRGGQSSGRGATRAIPNFDSSPFSPQMPAPQLRSEIFGSPNKGPRTPGISVQKARPFRSHKSSLEGGRKDPFGTDEADDRVWESSEVEDDLGISPPKTMQFVVPQSRLLQTPAREASKRIVEDLLLTAGGGEVTDSLNDIKYDEGDDIDLDLGDDSPSVVRKMGDLGADESF